MRRTSLAVRELVDDVPRPPRPAFIVRGWPHLAGKDRRGVLLQYAGLADDPGEDRGRDRADRTRSRRRLPGPTGGNWL